MIQTLTNTPAACTCWGSPLDRRCHLSAVWLTWIGVPLLGVLIALRTGWIAALFVVAVGAVAQIGSDCEILLCEDATRRDKGRIFIELNAAALAECRRERVERAVPGKEAWGATIPSRSTIPTATN